MRMNKYLFFFCAVLGLLGPRAYGQFNKGAADSLIARTVPAKASNFLVE